MADGDALGDDEVAAALGLMSPELKFVLAGKEVPNRLQAHLGRYGFKTLSTFAVMADTRADFRETLRGAPFSLDLTEGDADVRLQKRVNLARMIDAWETAKVRVEERARVESEQRASRLPVTVSATEHITLRRAYEAAHGRVEDKHFPADAALERRLAEVEQGDLKAESLKDMPSREESIEDPIGAVMDKDGALRLKKGIQQIALPSSSEELRRRVRMLGITYTLASLKHTNRTWLSTATPNIWLDHLDWVLGEDVHGFQVKLPNGQSRRPDWQVVLSYEHQLRKEAVRRVLYEGEDLAAALIAARRNTELKERHFVTPAIMNIALGANEEKSSSSRSGPYQVPWYNAPGKGGSKGKNRKGKDKSKSKDGVHAVTPDGRRICFAYNNPNERCRGSCGFVHCCRICFGKHPMHMHPRGEVPANATAGSAAPPQG